MSSDRAPVTVTSLSEQLLARTRAGEPLMAAAARIYSEHRGRLPQGVGVDELMTRSRAIARQLAA